MPQYWPGYPVSLLHKGPEHAKTPQVEPHLEDDKSSAD